MGYPVRGGIVRCGSTFPWLAFWFLLFASGTVSVSIHGEALPTAQSTTPGPAPQDGKPYSNADFTSSLKEALSLIEDALPILSEAKSEANAWKLDSQKWQAEATKLSSESTSQRKAWEERLRLSEQSLKQAEALKQAAQDRAKLDNDAVMQARSDRFWAYIQGGLVGIAAGACGVIAWDLWGKR